MFDYLNKNKFLTIFVVVIFLLPTFSFAIGIPTLSLFSPFGGKVVAVTPCVSSLTGSYAVEITEFPFGTGTYIWGPSTATFLMGPPKNPGQYLIGLAIPFVDGCPTSIIKGNPANFKGDQRMTMVGTSTF